jgi:hypothetical protein
MPAGIEHWRQFARLFCAFVAAACLPLLIPDSSRAGMITDSTELLAGSSSAQEEFTRLDDFSSYPGRRFLDEMLDSTPKTSDHASEPALPVAASEVVSITASSGGMTSIPPEFEQNLGSTGIVSDGSDRVRLSFLCNISIGQILYPNSPLADRLLDPPRSSA